MIINEQTIYLKILQNTSIGLIHVRYPVFAARELISEITVDQLHNVMDSLVERYELCVHFGGKLSGWTGD